MLSLLRDASMKITLALPNGAATVTSGGMDIGPGIKTGQVEYLLTAPALTTLQLPDGKTIRYVIGWSDSADLSNPTYYMTAAITQTGSGGAGASAATFRLRLPSTAGRYLFMQAIGSASGDASAAAASLEACF